VPNMNGGNFATGLLQPDQKIVLAGQNSAG
jgi:hypothetical protein